MLPKGNVPLGRGGFASLRVTIGTLVVESYTRAVVKELAHFQTNVGDHSISRSTCFLRAFAHFTPSGTQNLNEILA